MLIIYLGFVWNRLYGYVGVRIMVHLMSSHLIASHCFERMKVHLRYLISLISDVLLVASSVVVRLLFWRIPLGIELFLRCEAQRLTGQTELKIQRLKEDSFDVSPMQLYNKYLYFSISK